MFKLEKPNLHMTVFHCEEYEYLDVRNDIVNYANKIYININFNYEVYIGVNYNVLGIYFYKYDRNNGFVEMDDRTLPDKVISNYCKIRVE